MLKLSGPIMMQFSLMVCRTPLRCHGPGVAALASLRSSSASIGQLLLESRAGGFPIPIGALHQLGVGVLVAAIRRQKLIPSVDQSLRCLPQPVAFVEEGDA